MLNDPFMLDLFRGELETHARTLEQGLVAAEGESSAAKIEPLMRAAHSIKGAARIVGLDAGVKLAHAMEDILSAAQHGKLVLSSAHVDVLLRANDVFLKASQLDPSAIGPALESAPIDPLCQELQNPPAPSAPPPAPPVMPAPPKPEPPPAPAYAADMLDLLRIELENHAQVLDQGLIQVEADQTAAKIEPLMRAAHSIKGAARIVGLDLGVTLAHAMEDVLSAAQHGKLNLTTGHVDLLLRGNDVFGGLSKLPAQDIPGALDNQADSLRALAQSLRDSMTVAPAAAAKPAPAPPQPPPAPKAEPKKTEDGSVRVLAEHLNRLMGLAGECLVQAKSVKPLSSALLKLKQQQHQLGSAIEEVLQAGDLEQARPAMEEALLRLDQVRGTLPRFIAEFDLFATRLERLADRLYGEAVATRMRPFSDGLHGYPRMVRDLAKSLGKKVALEIQGSSTRVDRDILEKLEAPLTHLLRNAIDHGLESTEQRLAAGKPAEGKVTLDARHSSGMLSIVVSDDGSGIDAERLRRKVVEKGYVNEAMAADLSPAELMDFLFLPGFSTAGKVTEVSGRGVGLDVVQSMVHEVGGSVRVDSHPGAGTSFQLLLPLTLSVVRTLLVEVRGEVYAMPLARIDRIVRMSLTDVRTVEDKQFCIIDGENTGIIDARQALQLSEGERNGGQLSIAVISDRLNRYGLVVDRFLGERDLVVIPLHPKLGKVPNISAGAILEDGAPVLILDIDDLVRSIDSLLTRGTLQKVGRRREAEKHARKRILVVDDSLTVREVERRLLENHGYEVSVAVDGMDGWNAVQRGKFDLVISDVDMPRMDGIELVKRIKSTASTSHLPVMIVSYKDTEEYRMRGLEAGASYYLTKSSFHDEGLIKAVRDLVGGAN